MITCDKQRAILSARSSRKPLSVSSNKSTWRLLVFAGAVVVYIQTVQSPRVASLREKTWDVVWDSLVPWW